MRTALPRVRTQIIKLGVALTFISGCSSATATSSPAAPQPLPASAANSGVAGVEQFRGKVVVLAFGATWCPMCSIELRELERVHRRLAGEGLQIVAVLIDDDPEVVRSFVETNGLTFPVLTDSQGTLQGRFKISSLPATVALDRNGAQTELTDPESGEKVLQIDGPRSWVRPEQLEQLRDLLNSGKK